MKIAEVKNYSKDRKSDYVSHVAIVQITGELSSKKDLVFMTCKGQGISPSAAFHYGARELEPNTYLVEWETEL